MQNLIEKIEESELNYQKFKLEVDALNTEKLQNQSLFDKIRKQHYFTCSDCSDRPYHPTILFGKKLDFRTKSLFVTI